jgi:aryl-alcohol dehydrogenase-like predicted oxidoreductase
MPHPKSDLEFLGGDIENYRVPAHLRSGPRWEEIWQAMEQLVYTGKITYVGSSNFAAWNIAQANERARVRNFMGLVSEQSLYNLAVRDIELEVLPVAGEYGLGVIPWSPLRGGLLAGVKGTEPEGRRANMNVSEEMRRRLDSYEDLCRNLGEEPADVALAWLLHNPVVTAPIIGPRTLEQLESAARACEIDLTQETLAELDRIWPGPGNQAPEAYAW